VDAGGYQRGGVESFYLRGRGQTRLCKAVDSNDTSSCFRTATAARQPLPGYRVSATS
jgi:hypothetical protein